MSSIQKTLDSLQPYVIGIRYLDGMVVVDVIFKEGWTVPEVKNIQKVKGDEGMNYYMVFSEVSGVGLDDLLNYIDTTIKLNMDREKKHELLKLKVKELQEVFKKNTLVKLSKLKFTFTDDELEPKLSDIDVDIETPQIEETFVEEDVVEPVQSPSVEPIQYLDENKNPIPLTDEDKEILEEEARAKKFKQIQDTNKKKSEIKNINNKKIELPPKKVFREEPRIPVMSGVNCECGSNEACDRCIEEKDL